MNMQRVVIEQDTDNVLFYSLFVPYFAQSMKSEVNLRWIY